MEGFYRRLATRFAFVHRPSQRGRSTNSGAPGGGGRESRDGIVITASDQEYRFPTLGRSQKGQLLIVSARMMDAPEQQICEDE